MGLFHALHFCGWTLAVLVHALLDHRRVELAQLLRHFRFELVSHVVAFVELLKGIHGLRAFRAELTSRVLLVIFRSGVPVLFRRVRRFSRALLVVKNRHWFNGYRQLRFLTSIAETDFELAVSIDGRGL